MLNVTVAGVLPQSAGGCGNDWYSLWDYSKRSHTFELTGCCSRDFKFIAVDAYILQHPAVVAIERVVGAVQEGLFCSSAAEVVQNQWPSARRIILMDKPSTYRECQGYRACLTE